MERRRESRSEGVRCSGLSQQRVGSNTKTVEVSEPVMITDCCDCRLKLTYVSWTALTNVRRLTHSMDRTCTVVGIVALSCENRQKLKVMVIYNNTINGGMELTVH